MTTPPPSPPGASGVPSAGMPVPPAERPGALSGGVFGGVSAARWPSWRAVAVTLATAVLGGLAWAALTRVFGERFGIGLWLVGAVTGFAMLFATGGAGRRGGVTAALCVLIGLTAGMVQYVRQTTVALVVGHQLERPDAAEWALESFQTEAMETMIADGTVGPALARWFHDPRASAPPPELVGEYQAFHERLDRLTAAIPDRFDHEWVADYLGRDVTRTHGYGKLLQASFGFMELIFILLALFSAYKLGFGFNAA